MLGFTKVKLVVPPRGWHHVWGPVWGAIQTKTTKVVIARRKTARPVLTWLTSSGWITGWSYRGPYIVIQISSYRPPGQPYLSKWNNQFVRVGNKFFKSSV